MAEDREGPTPAKKPYKGIQQEERNEDARLVKWFCEDLGPYRILDYNGCRNYFKETIPNYTLPSMKKFLEELVPEQYRIVSLQLEKTLQSVHHVAISMDTWIHAYGRKRLKMWTGTVHYVHQGKLVSQILFTKPDKGQPRPKEEMMKNILSKWGLSDKVVCFITGYENNDSVIQTVHNLQKPNIFCAAAALRLTFQECYNYLTSNEEFKKKYESHYDSSKLKKKKEEPFCWHNQFVVLQQMSETTAVGEEQTELAECVQILKPFVDTANDFSKEQYLTLSSIIPLTFCLQLKISRCSPSTDRAKDLKNKLLDAIDSYFGVYENEPLASKATFIDPRFTKLALKASIKNSTIDRSLKGEKASLVEKEVIEELYGQNPGNPNSSNHCDQPTPSTSNNLPEEKVLANDSKIDSPFAILDESVKTEMTNNETMIVVQEVKIPKINATENPFEFWEKYKSSDKYKKLYRMSKKYLCIPATAVHAESISGEFLWAKAVLNNQSYNERRNQEFINIDQILFLHSYYSRN